MRKNISLSDAAVIYSDGACSGNPGPGGWASIVAWKDSVYELGAREISTTNNRMELSGVLQGLQFLESKNFSPEKTIYVLTDSTYVIRAMTQWVWGWMRKGWKTAEGKEVLNQDLVEALFRETKKYKSLQWRYVRGHEGTAGNERCDEIAVSFSQGRSVSLFSGPAKDYIFDVYTLPEEQPLPEMKGPGEKKVAYSYLSVIGSKVIRHKDWSSCERRVKGQSGAKFKKAFSEADEIEILKAWGFSAGHHIEES